MDRVKVDIKARETIKPSSPTPYNLKIFNLSLLDQIAPPVYALTQIYPLAGRVTDNLFIECNEGAEFLEAHVNFPLHEILRQPEVYVLDQLLPQEYHSNNLEAQLAVQVNFFSCEGMAIGTCMFHKIVDGATFSSFVNMWAAIARNSGDSDILCLPSFQGHSSSLKGIYQPWCEDLKSQKPSALQKDLSSRAQ
ncbi:salutaridinol 7-O-acetyltransferase-like [Corylus avellana]|uniref:salutaridinol 7-O-acetyltransferase-like n=1 Tax=Corylus avellana TaxID=13451 RepID=UPI00286AB867|nr:salutaridinol 7-O-acetyltransferase-like [Corylus avellana]